MPQNKNNKFNSRKEKQKSKLEPCRLKIKKELEEIIEQTERQNKALDKITENKRDKVMEMFQRRTRYRIWRGNDMIFRFFLAFK